MVKVFSSSSGEDMKEPEFTKEDLDQIASMGITIEKVVSQIKTFPLQDRN